MASAECLCCSPPQRGEKRTLYATTGQPLLDIDTAYRCERMANTGDVIADWVGTGNSKVSGSIYDWYGNIGGQVGFKGTFQENSSPLFGVLWSPLIAIAQSTFTQAAAGTQISNNFTSFDYSDTSYSFVQAGSGYPLSTLSFDYQNFGGTIGYRWVLVTTSNVDGEVLEYDLGPAANVYDPEFSAIQYTQNQTPYAGSYQGHTGSIVEQFGELVGQPSL